jgi:hypothetical protein
MEVHHHAHTPGKKWTHYLWEFLMLFLAVFCGFLAENQREHLTEIKRAKEYAKALMSDLESDTLILGKDLIDIAERSHEIDSFLFYLDKYRKEKVATGVLYYYGFRIEGGLEFSVKTATLEQMKNSGSLRYFKNFRLVQLINEYDEAVWTQIRRKENDLITREKVKDAFEAVFDFYHAKEMNSLRMRGAPKDSLIKLNGPLLNASSENINKLANAVWWRRATLVNWQNTFYKKPYDLAIELIKELQKEYKLK